MTAHLVKDMSQSMKIALAFAATAVWVYAPASRAADAEATDSDRPSPRIVCPDPVHDFGEQEDATLVKHVFVLRNEGGAPLHITRVKPDCGCTATTLGATTLAPGEQVELVARLDLKGRRGPQRKSILIQSNDPETPRIFLWMRGSVIHEIELIPSLVNFGVTATNQVRTATVRLLSRTPGVTITDLVSESPSFAAAHMEPDTNGAPRFRVATVPPLAAGMVRGEIGIRTSSPRKPEMTLVVLATVMDTILVIPREMALKQDMVGPLNRSVFLRPGTVREFHVLDVTPPVPGIRVSTRMLPGGTWRIDLRDIPVSRRIDGKAIRIRTDVDGAEEIEIPIRLVP